MPARGSEPDLSVVVVVYNMAREAPRTLLSLSTTYQRHISAEDYEVIVVDNGSSPPLDASILGELAGNFRLLRVDDASPSPAKAINLGLREARGQVIGVMIDGARLVTPGLLHFARQGARLFDRAVVASLGYYLGFDLQRWSMQAGHGAEREDALLAEISWPQDGYRLFEIATMDESSVGGWLQTIPESNTLFLSRHSWDLLGGVEERFDSPGGGLLNLDTCRRAMELPGSELVILLGEGSFHQLHGGIATNADVDTFRPRFEEWCAQYQAIRGTPWKVPSAESRTYLGTLPRLVLVDLVQAATKPLSGLPPPVGAVAKTPPPKDPTTAALMALAENRLAAGLPRAAAQVARLARLRAPNEPAPQRMLARVGPSLSGKQVPVAERAAFHFSVGEAYRLLGDNEKATAEFLAALAVDNDFLGAHTGLAKLRLPGKDYKACLRSLHEILSPEVYLEIGVAAGATLALAQPPTFAIGIDPQPKINTSLKTQTCISTDTSDDFFASDKLSHMLAGRVLNLAFIDGLHVFEQALRDFINVERFCGPRSVVLFHDTLPLDEPTQRPVQHAKFYTGDVWKTILCIKHYRPDLKIITIAAPSSGLTMMTGLNPQSKLLSENYSAAVSQFVDMPFVSVENDLPAALNVFPNDWDQIAAYLRSQGIVAA